MAKNQSTAASKTPLPRVTREGLTKHAGDVLGFHDLEDQGHIYGIPRAAKASDSQLDPKKPSVFVIFELLEECKYTEGSGEDASVATAKSGEMVGVWVKGGMRNLRNMGGLKVLMQFTGEKKLKGKPAAYNAMKLYDFDTDASPTKKGQTLTIIEDNRKESRDVVNYWLPSHKAKPLTSGTQQERQPGEDDEDYDFPS